MNGRRVRVKICGLGSAEAARVAAEAGADAVGVVLARSRRQLAPEEARSVLAAVPPFVTRAGVLVNEPLERAAELARYLELDVIQLHGDESPDYCRALREMSGRRVIKAVRVAGPLGSAPVEAYASAGVDAILADTAVPGVAGGSGQTFDWSWVRPDEYVLPVILAGGLNADNVRRALSAVRPYGVDVSSGVETGGVKDPEKIRAFIAAVRAWECGGG